MSNINNEVISENLNDGGTHHINKEGLREMVSNSKLLINCSICKSEWMVGDKERTEEEKKTWVCPNCIDEMNQARINDIREDEIDPDQMRDEHIDMAHQEEEESEGSADYPLGGMAEPFDIDNEQKLTHGFGAY